MTELVKIKQRILEIIEEYIADMEMTEVLTFNEKTILDSVKEIINEEFEKTPAPLPRFIIHENGEMEQIKTSNGGEKFTDVEAEKFKEFINEYTGTTTEIKKRIFEESIKWTETILKISNTYGVSYNIAKDIVIQIIEELKKPYMSAAKWVVAGIGIDCLGHRFKEYKCSKCGNIDYSHRKNKFCPECGRRMEG